MSEAEANAVYQTFRLMLLDAEVRELNQLVCELAASSRKESVREVQSQIVERVSAAVHQNLAALADLQPMAASHLSAMLEQWKKTRQI